jgi:phosphate transport system substrate-binding protein
MKTIRLGALAAVIAAGPMSIPTVSQAESLLSGPRCSQVAPAGSVPGTGASFAGNAHNNVFRPAYRAACNISMANDPVSYASTGSGAGKTAFITHSNLIAGSDEPLSIDEQANGMLDTVGLQGRVSPAHHLPIALGAITVAANLTHCGIGSSNGSLLPLKLRSQVIGSIYSGLISDWGDDLIAVDNPNLDLSNCGPIKLAARLDASGTTYAFKDFLSKRNPQFQVFKQNQLNQTWPAESLGVTILRGQSNQGVAAIVDTVPGSIGYVELSEALRTRTGTGAHTPIDYVQVDNPLGEWISPKAGSGANCSQASLGMTHPASTLSVGWDAVSITDAATPGAYPICTLTYLLMYNNLGSAFPSATDPQIQTVIDYAAVALLDSTQGALNGAGYARLPETVLTVARNGVATLANL